MATKHATHKANTHHAKAHPVHPVEEEKKEEPQPVKEEAPSPYEQHEARIASLVQAVKDAFTQGGFTIPGDLETQIRNMAAH